ncbi:hypothetical protein DB31_2356 [Hyalangium minutum]|uniref:Uncharacterized protein n=1 Tax=Hyalangium minutum TaxID=394096 RepID=A0A085W8D1_9BACT|nr:hypothetical protein DB31_2356 [Hyalangium minutum]
MWGAACWLGRRGATELENTHPVKVLLAALASKRIEGRSP